MKTFTDIRQFKDVVHHVRRTYTNAGRPLPTLAFSGRVKLHGTNAGIRWTPGTNELHALSRTRIINTTDDNNGFARFVEDNHDALVALFLEHFPDASDQITVFGEWCGGNIQDRVALNQCPRHLVLFKMWNHGAEVWANIPASFEKEDSNIYNINSLPVERVQIDFTAPQNVQDELADLVARYEEQCPWSKTKFNVDGVGEGLVFTCDDYPMDSDLWFKAKGSAHAKSAKASKVRIVADPEKVESIQQLVDRDLLPDWRLSQGIEMTKQAIGDEPLGAKHTPVFLKWVMGDVLKEEQLAIEASGFDWKKDLVGPLTQRARQYFLTEVNRVC